MNPRLTGDHAALLDFAISHSPVVYFTSDPSDDFRITYISDNVERLSGFTPEAITADPELTRRHIYEDDLASLRRALANLTPERPQECEYRFRRPDGERMWIREELRLIGEDGAGQRVVGCLIDITAQVEAERERKRLSDLLNEAIDSMPTGLVVYDAEDRVVVCNEAVTGLYGEGASEFEGRHATEMAEFAADFIRSIDGARPDSRETLTRTLLDYYDAADGTEFELEYVSGRLMLMSIQRTAHGFTVVTRSDITERKAAEREIAHTVDQYQTFLDNSPSSIVKIDTDLRYTYVNPAYGRRIGKSPEDVLGHSIAEAVGRDNADSVAPHLRRALSGERVQWQGWAEYAATGRRFVERDYQPDYDVGGDIVGVIAFTHDLTELKEAQSSLEEREARFRTIAEAVPLPVVIVRNRKRDIVFANRLAEDVVGANVGAQSDFLEDRFVDPEVRTAFFSRLARKRRVDGFEAELLLPNQGRRWHILSARVMTYDGDSATLTTCTDITDRKQAEQRLNESEIQHRTVLENVPSEIEHYDRDRRYIYANPAYCERLGRTLDEIVGRTVADVVGQEVSDNTAEFAAQALAGGSAELQRWHTYENAGDRFMQRIYQPDVDADGNVVGYFAFTHDLTELKKAQSALEEREARFRAIAEAVPLPIFIVRNRDRQVVFANHLAENVLGAAVGKPATFLEGQFVDREKFAEFRAHLAKDGHVGGLEAELKLPLVGHRWSLISAQVMDYDGESATLTTSIDISDRKRTEQALAASEIQHRTVLENTPLGISQLDHDRRYVYANPAYCDRVGKSEAEIIGHTVVEVVGNAIAELTAPYAERALAGESSIWQRWQTYESAGDRFMERSYQPDFDADGNVVGYFAFTHDLTELQRAQSALEEREARFRAIAEAIPLPIVVIDKEDRRILFTNELATDQMGVRSGDPSGKLEQMFVDSNSSRQFATEIMGDRGVTGVEAQTRRTDGTVIWELIFGHDMIYDGRPAKFATSIDLTDRKRAEQALRESEARFRDFAESASDWFWETDEDFRLAWFSTDIHPLTGERTSELFGESIQRDESYRASDAELDRLFETVEARQPFKDVHLRREVPGGRTRDLSLSAVPFHDESGRFKGYRGSTSDITVQKRAEEALRASEAQTRTILDNIPAHVVLAGKDRRLKYVNRRYREFRKTTDERSLGQSTADILGKENATLLAPYSEQALAGENVEWQGWLNDPFAGEMYQQRVYQPYRGASGDIEGYLTFVRDLTDQKRTEQELEKQRELLHQNEKLAALGSLLAGVAHELNNPLSVVVGRSIMLADEVDDPGISNAVGRIRDAAERCARIVKTFLAMARQQAPSRQPAAINDLVHASLDMVEYNLRTTDVRIELHLADDLPLISADPDQLSQVLVNLCINSGQAMENADQRRLSISTAFDSARDRIGIDVADTGSGISEENISRIFDPFFTTKPLGVGTGVGLSISHAIVTSHDGTIDVSSEVGHGTVFHLTFPVAPDLDTPEDEGAPGPVSGAASILVVDDEVDIADMLAELLGAKGHRVEIAHSGREALGRLEHTEFDLIISDLKMPDVGGRELYRLVEADRPHLRRRFLFITGDTLGADAATFIGETGLVCLEKPLLPSDVIAEVDRALERAGD